MCRRHFNSVYCNHSKCLDCDELEYLHTKSEIVKEKYRMSSVLESNVFQNQQIPQSVVILSKIMPDISDSTLNAVFKLVLDAVQRKPLPPKLLEKLFKKLDLAENGDHLFGGLLMLLQAVLRLPPDSLKESDLRQGLKELKFSDECCNEFISVFQANKNDLYVNKSKFGFSYFSKLETFNWRVDITISSNFLAKSLDTVIIFQLNLKNGESKTFEVSIAKFHQLRFYVSCMLKELEFIEKKNVFKT